MKPATFESGRYYCTVGKPSSGRVERTPLWGYKMCTWEELRAIKCRFLRLFFDPTPGKASFAQKVMRRSTNGRRGSTRDWMGYPTVYSGAIRIHKQKTRRPSDWRKVHFLTVFRIFQGHPLTLRDSKGHVCNLLFRDGFNGTGRDALRGREGRKRLKSTNSSRYSSRLGRFGAGCGQEIACWGSDVAGARFLGRGVQSYKKN